MFSQRTRDWIYFAFFILHLPITIFVDVQALYFVDKISPLALRKIYLFAQEGDPLLENALSSPWFQSFLFLEVVFQLPVFVLGARGLWKGSRGIWPLLTIYGASSATSTIACLFTVIQTPGINPQLPKLLASYLPFFLIPAAIAIDFGTRLSRLATQTEGKIGGKTE